MGYAQYQKQQTKQGISKKQLIIIHACKNKLGWSDERYRSVLFGFREAESSKDLSYSEAWEFIQLLHITMSEQQIPIPTKRRGKDTHADLHRYAEDNSHLATSRQLRTIESLWRTLPKIKNRSDESLRKLIKRITKCDQIRWLSRQQASTIIRRLEDYK